MHCSAAEGTQAYKRNPALRAHLALGVFYDRSHPLLVQAAVGAALARRNPHALVLALPYLWNARNRCRASGGRITQTAFYPVFDAVQIAATVRGAVRNRTSSLGAANSERRLCTFWAGRPKAQRRRGEAHQDE